MARAGFKASAASASSSWTGYWTLDKTASDSVRVHLENMQLVADIAQQAAEKLDIAYTIIQEAGGVLFIRHSSALAEKDKRLVPGQDHLETARDGSVIRQTLEYVSPIQFRISSDWSKGRVVQTRTLAEGGQVMVEAIDYTHSPSGRRTITNRTFRRAAPPAAAEPEDG